MKPEQAQAPAAARPPIPVILGLLAAAAVGAWWLGQHEGRGAGGASLNNLHPPVTVPASETPIAIEEHVGETKSGPAKKFSLPEALRAEPPAPAQPVAPTPDIDARITEIQVLERKNAERRAATEREKYQTALAAAKQSLAAARKTIAHMKIEMGQQASRERALKHRIGALQKAIDQYTAMDNAAEQQATATARAAEAFALRWSLVAISQGQAIVTDQRDGRQYTVTNSSQFAGLRVASIDPRAMEVVTNAGIIR